MGGQGAGRADGGSAVTAVVALQHELNARRDVAGLLAGARKRRRSANLAELPLFAGSHGASEMMKKANSLLCGGNRRLQWRCRAGDGLRPRVKWEISDRTAGPG